jgi:hypothetical protein
MPIQSVREAPLTGCDYHTFKKDFLRALDMALEWTATFYNVEFENPPGKPTITCIHKIVEDLFTYNPRLVQKDIDHLMTHLPDLSTIKNPEKSEFTICRYAAFYGALLFADTVIRIAIQEATTIPPTVKCGYALMAIRDTNGWGWGDQY